MRQISLNEKLVVYFVILGVSGLIAVALFSFYTTKQALLSRTFDQLISVRVNKKKQVESFFEDRVRDIRLMADNDEAVQLAQWLTGQTDSKNPAVSLNNSLQQYLTNYLKLAGDYRNIIFVNNREQALYLTSDTINQKIHFSFGNALDLLPANMIKKSMFTGTLIHDLRKIQGTSQPVLFISSPVEKFHGRCAIIFEMTLTEINRIMLENNPEDGLGASGESYLVGPDTLMRSKSRFLENAVLSTFVNTAGVRQAMEGRSGISIIDDYRGISVLSSYGPLEVPGLDWVILAEIDTAEVMAPVYNLRTDFLVIGMLITTMIFAFAFFLSRSITSPIIKLKNAAGKIAGGTMEVNLPIQSNDEIGELTIAFNTMAAQLNRQQEELAEERKMRLRSMIDGQENERQRLSRDLHDGLGQSLIAIKLQLENYCETVSSGDHQKMEKIKTYFEQTIEDIRRMSNDLAPSVLEEFGLTTGLRNLCLNFSNQSGIAIKFENTGKIPSLEKKTSIYLYRICQEALSNAIRHSGATNIDVQLNYADSRIQLQVKDNGKGFDPEKISKHGSNGLSNLRERTQLLNGFLQIISSPEKGTRIRFECKIQEKKS